MGSLAFELGRKIRLPEEEISGVDSYSSVHGRARAGRILSLVVVLGAVFAVMAIGAVAPPQGRLVVTTSLLAAGTLAGILTSRPGRPAKNVELGSSVFLLISLLAMGVAAW